MRSQFVDELERRFADCGKLSREEERDLVGRMRGGDLLARERIVVNLLKLVCRLARRMTRPPLPIEDAFSAGLLGLLDGLDRFDETRGFRVSSYCIWYARRGIQDAYTRESLAISLPQRVPPGSPRAPVLFSLSGRRARPDGPVEVRRRRDPEVEDIEQAIAIEDRSASRRVREVDELDSREELLEVLRVLPPRVAWIVRVRTGFDGFTLSLAQAGAELGISKERVRQLEAKGLQILRRSLLHIHPSGGS